MSYRAQWRLANQHAKGMLDFSGSERCIEAIARRGELRAVNHILDRILKEPKPDTGRPAPPHRSGGGYNYVTLDELTKLTRLKFPR